MSKRLNQQIQFMREIDRLKGIVRNTYLISEKRKENSAEHSWHAAVMVSILTEYANEKINPLRVIKMLLIHDIVEIDAGDTYIYDLSVLKEQSGKECLAAERLFGLLPKSQKQEYLNLWLEFESQHTHDAKFAKAIDRAMPIIHNYFTQGLSWRERKVTFQQVLENTEVVRQGSQQLWRYIKSLLEDAKKNGFLQC